MLVGVGLTKIVTVNRQIPTLFETLNVRTGLRLGRSLAPQAAPGRILPDLASENSTLLPEKWAQRSVVAKLQ